MSLIEKISEEETINNIIINHRPTPEIIKSKKFEKSIEIISQFDYIINENNEQFSHKLCEFCKNYFPIIEGKDYSCKQCNETFCLIHRESLNHKCEKLTPAFEKYLMAKNILKNRMRMIKSKGH